jgi:asparagine synthase (glutamine-hydrolysing)
MQLYMKNQLLKDSDYMSMWHGLEIRVPFMDKELVEAINSIAPLVKFRGTIPKSLLIESFATLLPAEIWHRKKQGFTFPFAYWLKTSEQLRPESVTERKVFGQFSTGKAHWSRYWAVKVAALEKF